MSAKERVVLESGDKKIELGFLEREREREERETEGGGG